MFLGSVLHGKGSSDVLYWLRRGYPAALFSSGPRFPQPGPSAVWRTPVDVTMWPSRSETISGLRRFSFDELGEGNGSQRAGGRQCAHEDAAIRLGDHRVGLMDGTSCRIHSLPADDPLGEPLCTGMGEARRRGSRPRGESRVPCACRLLEVAA
jgi:hypothetical protein